MIVTCNNCKSAFTVNDEKVQGKKFAFNCPKCSHNNIINMSSESVLPKAVETVASNASAAVRNGSEVSDDSFFDFDDDQNSSTGSFTDEHTSDEDDENNGLPIKNSGVSDDDFEDFEYEDEIEPELDMSLLNSGSEENDFDNDDDIIDDGLLSEMEAEVPDMEQKIEEDDMNIDLDSMDLPVEMENEEFPSVSEFSDTVPDFSSDELSDAEVNMLTEIPDTATETTDTEPFDEDDEITFDIDAYDDQPATENTGTGPELSDLDDNDLNSLDLELAGSETDNDEESGEIIDDFPESGNTGLIMDDIGEDDIPELGNGDISIEDFQEDDLPELSLEGISSDEDDDITVFSQNDHSLSDTEENITEDFSQPKSEESLSIDLDALDLDIDDNIDQEPEQDTADTAEDEQLSIDIDSLDIDLEEITSGTQQVREETEDSALSIDLDSLDIDLEDTEDDSGSERHANEVPEDEALSIDLDSLDIDLDDSEIESAETLHAEDETEDETLSIDLDSLDVDLDEEAEKISSVPHTHEVEDAEDETLSIDLDSLDIDIEAEPGDKSPDIEDEDETLSIDLDSLDVDLDEEAEISTAEISGIEKEDDSDFPFDLDDTDFDDRAPIVLSEDEDTLNTDNLALDIDPHELGIIPPNNERKPKAGTRISRISPAVDEQRTFKSSEADDFSDEILYPLDDEMDESAVDGSISDEILFDNDEMITIEPLDDDDEYKPSPAGRKPVSAVRKDHSEIPLSDVALDVMPEVDLEKMYDDEELTITSSYSNDDPFDINVPDIVDEEKESVAGSGYINFSIDYTLKYSRLRALAKLLGLNLLTLIPHFIVLLLYSIVSVICGLFNNIISAFNGEAEKDFTRFQEKTLRYATGIIANILNVIEEHPPYAGTESIDTTLQLQAYPPIKYSRFLAVMRLSIAGIVLLALPHIIILGILTIALIPFTLIGLIANILAASWPSFLLDYAVRYLRYLVNVVSYITGVVDAYPSFRFD